MVEVFLAATIVAVGFFGVAGAFSYAAKTSRLARDTMAAEIPLRNVSYGPVTMESGADE